MDLMGLFNARWPAICEVNGWLSYNEAKLLFLFAARAERPVAEIGAYQGKSSLAIATGSEHGRQVPVYSVDPHFSSKPTSNQAATYGHEDMRQWYANIERRTPPGWITPCKLTLPSEVAAASLKMLGMRLDFVFVDGDHSYEAVMQDIHNWYDLLVFGGVLLFHDREEGGVAQAIEDCVTLYRLRHLFYLDRIVAYAKVRCFDRFLLSKQDAIHFRTEYSNVSEC